jgi:hypothetical protein
MEITKQTEWQHIIVFWWCVIPYRQKRRSVAFKALSIVKIKQHQCYMNEMSAHRETDRQTDRQRGRGGVLFNNTVKYAVNSRQMKYDYGTFVEWYQQGKNLSTQSKTSPSAISSTTYPTQTGLESNPGPSGHRTVPNTLNNVMCMCNLVQFHLLISCSDCMVSSQNSEQWELQFSKMGMNVPKQAICMLSNLFNSLLKTYKTWAVVDFSSQ